MKSFAITLLIIGACFLGYDRFLAPPNERMVFPRPPETVASPGSPESPAPVVPKPAEVQAEPARIPSAPVAVPASSAEPPKLAAATPADTASAFHAPKVESIEDLTSNWKKLPKTAFPRAVKLLKDTTFKLSFGASVVRAGTQAVALALDNGMVVVAPNEGSAAQQVVPVDDTDLKDRLTAIYEQWKADRVADARRQFEERQRHPQSAASTATAGVDDSGKPVISGDGTYPLLMAQLHTGSPSEITPFNITRWGAATQETIKGNPTWTVPVTYKAKTMFGVTEVDTLAHVQKGRVVEWIYKGSGEPVP